MTRTRICLLCAALMTMSSACGPTPLEYALECSGDNRPELEKVLERYSSNPGDSLKYQAAVFLIENMPYYGYYEGEQLQNYFRYYPILRSVLRRGGSPSEAADSVKRLYGPYDESLLTRKRDIETVDSAYLCHNIDWAFKVWREQPWGKNVSFDEFKEKILPYRIGDETLAYWRETYYNYYNHLFIDEFFKMEGVDIEDPVQAAKFISNNVLWLDQLHFTTTAPASLPHIGPDIAWNKCGSCRELSDFVVYACRALGIPCSVDFMPVLGNQAVGHSWVSMTDKEGRLYYQEFLRGIQMVDSSHLHLGSKWKVFRNTFSSPGKIDVTPFYACDYIPELEVPSSCFYPVTPHDTVWLCASTKFDWTPVASAPFSRKKVVFRNIDRGDIARLAFVNGGKMTFLTEPFYLDSDHQLHFLSANGKSSDIAVFSKTALSHESEFSSRMVGGVFEGSNYPDFKEKDTIYMIRETPRRLVERVSVPASGPYRYLRYYGPENGYCNVSEVTFRQTEDGAPLTGHVIGTPGCMEGDGSHEYVNVFDGNPWTSFNYSSPNGGWAGLDLGSPKKVGHISYTHRNMDNYVRPGDVYRLYYCDINWKLADELTAVSDSLVFRDVPEGLLYLLVDVTRGVHAEVFSYQDGQQVWEHE